LEVFLINGPPEKQRALTSIPKELPFLYIQRLWFIFKLLFWGKIVWIGTTSVLVSRPGLDGGTRKPTKSNGRAFGQWCGSYPAKYAVAYTVPPIFIMIFLIPRPLAAGLEVLLNNPPRHSRENGNPEGRV
jgi:hypothetical protein